MQEKYRQASENLESLNKWLEKVEREIASQEVPREDPDQLRNQINAFKVGDNVVQSYFYGHKIIQWCIKLKLIFCLYFKDTVQPLATTYHILNRIDLNIEYIVSQQMVQGVSGSGEGSLLAGCCSNTVVVVWLILF